MLADVEWQMIMQGLNIVDLMHFSGCNKSLRKVASHSFAWKNSPTIDIEVNNTLSRWFSLLQKLHILCEQNSPLIYVSLDVHVYQDVDKYASTVAIFKLLLKHQNRLTSLAVDICNLNNKAFLILCDIIKNCQQLSTFNFACDNFDDSGAHHLSKAIQHSKSNHLITTLDFTNNNLGYEKSMAFASAIKSCPNLTNLKLYNYHKIDSQFHEIIMDALQHCQKISKLDFSDYSIGPKGIAVLAKFISQSTSVTELNYANCVNSDDIIVLANAIKHNKTMTKISIKKGTKKIDNTTLSTLVDAIKMSSSLTSVDFSGCGLNENGIKILCDAVKYSNTIIKLDISKNYFLDEVAIDAIADMLSHNKIVRHLDISACDIYDTHISILADAIMYNNKGNLKTLDLNWNHITSIGAAYLIKAVLSSQTTLTHLNLTCNTIYEGFKTEAYNHLREKNLHGIVEF